MLSLTEKEMMRIGVMAAQQTLTLLVAVSYTHLDVYKRQSVLWSSGYAGDRFQTGGRQQRHPKKKILR